MIAIIDNYDSFTYNLYQFIGSIDPDIRVFRNDAISPAELRELDPDHIVISPGPGKPSDAGKCIEIIRELGPDYPILGVCLGHQAICEAYGAHVGYAERLMHGKQSTANRENSVLFSGLAPRFKVARYHSLAADRYSIPDCLRVTARTDDGEIMAVQHKSYPTFGVQFHPESIMTPDGMTIIANFLAVPRPGGPKFPTRAASAASDAADAPGEAEGVDAITTANPLIENNEQTHEKEHSMIQEAIFKIVDKQDLSYDESYAVMNEIMSGETTPTQTAAFLAALSTKSTKAETIDEIAGCGAAMRDQAEHLNYNEPLFEIVGTGGDKAGSFNVSTTAAMVIAAAGVKVAKHGNRAASSKCGTADVQEALGANINQDPELCAKLLDEVGFCFCFAQKYHPAMRYVGAIRKELGIRTVFNILGPLTNPAGATKFLLGVYDESLVQPLAEVLSTLGVEDGMVVFGRAVLDELSSACDTVVCEFHKGFYRNYVVKPEDFGLPRCSKEDLLGGDPAENAAITRGILDGSISGPKRDTVLMSAGAGLYLNGKADSLEQGIRLAASLIDSGAALATLEKYIEVSNS